MDCLSANRFVSRYRSAAQKRVYRFAANFRARLTGAKGTDLNRLARSGKSDWSRLLRSRFLRSRFLRSRFLRSKLPRTNVRRVAICVAMLLLAAGTMSPVAIAVPPIISEPHPYDPDWPTVHWVLSTKCRNCHTKQSDEERTDFTTYATLMQACVDGDVDSPVVRPGDPEDSYFWQYVSWNAHGDPNSDLPDTPEMPPDQPNWLTPNQLESVYRWIQNGAQQFKSPRACKTLTELDFPSAQVCANCHPKQFEEWSRSMHAYAQQSPVFEAFNLTLVERTGGTIGTFCTRCHTEIGTALGENESLRNVQRSRVSLEGITCVVCHRRSTAHYKSSGRTPMTPGPLESTCMFGPFETEHSVESGGHPSGHRPYIKTSQFCGECHDVVAPNGVRNEEAFSEWQQSPAAKAGITCQNCHMGPVQGVAVADCDRPMGYAAVVPGPAGEQLKLRPLSDHTFAGPDYSMLPDTEFPFKLDWMYEIDYRDPSKLTPHQQVTLRDLRRRNRASLAIARDKRYEVLSNAARIHVSHPESASCGSRIKIRVDVQSRFPGHNFPTGFMAERQVWLSVEVRDPRGEVVFVSGDLDHNLDLRDEHSHEVLTGQLHYDRFLFNLQSPFTGLTHKGTERTLVLPINRHLDPLNVIRPAVEPAMSFGRPSSFRLAKGSLPPLKTLGQTYPLRLPRAAGRYTLNVRLNFRHLPPTLLDHIGVPHLKKQLEIVELDQYCGEIVVGEGNFAPGVFLRMRGWHGDE